MQTGKIDLLKSIGDKTIIVCPHCNAQQSVSVAAISVFCKSCQAQIRVQEVLHPVSAKEEKKSDEQTIVCFRCKNSFLSNASSNAVLCKKCGYRNEIQDYVITSSFSRNIETKGSLEVRENGSLLNTTVVVQKAVIYGKFVGSIEAEQVYLKNQSFFEGSIKAQSVLLEQPKKLIIKKNLDIERLIIMDIFKGYVQLQGVVELQKTAMFDGHITARNLIVADGAFFSGIAVINPSQSLDNQIIIK